MQTFKNKIKTSVSPILTISTLERLGSLFSRKNWDVDENINISLFNRYANTLKTLDQSQQNFFLDLSERFIHVPVSYYVDNLIKPLATLRNEDLNANLIFSCCLPKEDIGHVKSSHTVLYQMKGSTIKTKILLNPNFIIEDLSTLKWDDIKKKNYRIVLVDDFVGTGSTAIEAIKYVLDLFPEMDKRNICVLCIVGMKNGLKLINDFGCKTYCANIQERGITDFFKDEDLKHATEQMEKIESSLRKLKDEYKFGYGRSEALVCMERCPNNTFPIYWLTKNISPYER